jgi:Flp pilus assembly protein TadG
MRAILARFRKAKDGLAAVEFAMLLPVMITLFFGVVELSLALACRADVTNMASAAADLVAQEQSISATDMANVFNASTAILYPYKTSPLTVTIYSIVDDGAKGTGGKVAWSCTKVGSANATTGSTTVPTDGYGTSGNPTTGGQMIANGNLVNGTPTYGSSGSVIIAKVDYLYSSPTTKVITGDIKMSNVFYARPRRVSQIPKPTACS